MDLTDEQVKTVIVNRLRRDARVDASNVLVEVNGHIAKLYGTVLSHEARTAAYEKARDTHGVLSVDNQLTVAYPRTVTVPADGEIKANAEKILEWNPDFDAGKIRVNVDMGVLTLTGTVDWYWQARKAERLMGNLKGVLFVKNEMVAVPTEMIADKMIAKDIEDELRCVFLVNAHEVNVKVANGVVTLTGTVGSYNAKWSVYEVVAHTIGVVDVNNKLRVSPEITMPQ